MEARGGGWYKWVEGDAVYRNGKWKGMKRGKGGNKDIRGERE